MNKNKKFNLFLESIKTSETKSLIEAIQTGFKLLTEAVDKIEIGSSPYGEDCAQVGTPDYQEKAKKELVAYRNQLIRQFGQPPEGVVIKIKGNPHDFGTYYELVAVYNEDDEQAAHYAYQLEGEGPEFWDAEAKKELGIADEGEDKGAKYTSIIHMQGEEANVILDIIKNEGEEVGMEMLKRWDYGDGGEDYNEAPWGSRDETYESGDYIMSYNSKSVGLTKKNW